MEISMMHVLTNGKKLHNLKSNETLTKKMLRQMKRNTGKKKLKQCWNLSA